jgi:hypothetical protein
MLASCIDSPFQPEDVDLAAVPAPTWRGIQGIPNLHLGVDNLRPAHEDVVGFPAPG